MLTKRQTIGPWSRRIVTSCKRTFSLCYKQTSRTTQTVHKAKQQATSSSSFHAPPYDGGEQERQPHPLTLDRFVFCFSMVWSRRSEPGQSQSSSNMEDDDIPPPDVCDDSYSADYNDETHTKKEYQIHTCLNRSDGESIDLTVLRQAAYSSGGLCTNRIRRQAWPKLVAAHQVLLQEEEWVRPAVKHHHHHPPPWEESDCHINKSISLSTKELRHLVQSVRWKKDSPTIRHVESGLSLDRTVRSSSSLSISLLTTASPPSLRYRKHLPQQQEQHHHHHYPYSKERRAGHVSFEQDILANEEQETLLQLLQHLQRRYPSLPIHQGTADMLAVLWRVLDRPSLTSITSLQLFPYHWQMKSPSFLSSVFWNVLEDMDMELYHHFQQYQLSDDEETTFKKGISSDSRLPNCIQESWIPFWMSQDINNFQILTSIWDVFLSSHPMAICHFSVALVVHFREALLSAKQSPIFHAILEQLPRRLDDRTIEFVLSRSVSSIQQQSPSLSVDDYGPSPDWVHTSSAPTDDQVLHLLRKRRQDTAAASGINKDLRLPNIIITTSDAEETKTTDEDILAISPLLPSASYPTLLKIMQQLENEGHRRRQIANRLKESRKQEVTRYGSSRLETLPSTVSQPSSISLNACSTVRLLPKTTTQVESWIKEQNPVEYITHSVSMRTPDTASPCSTPESFAPRTTFFDEDTAACMDIPCNIMVHEKWRDRVISSWRRTLLAVLLLVFSYLMKIRIFVGKEQSGVWSPATTGDSHGFPVVLKRDTIFSPGMELDSKGLLSPKLALVDVNQGDIDPTEDVDRVKRDRTTTTSLRHATAMVVRNESTVDVGQQEVDDDYESPDVAIRVEEAMETEIEKPSLPNIMFMVYGSPLTQATLFLIAMPGILPLSDVLSQEPYHKEDKENRKPPPHHLAPVLLAHLRHSVTSTGGILRSPTVQTTTMTPGSGVDYRRLVFHGPSNQTLVQWRGVLAASIVAQNIFRSFKTALGHGSRGVRRVTHHSRHAVSNGRQAVLAVSTRAKKTSIKSFRSGREVIQSQLPVLKRESMNLLAAGSIFGRQELENLVRRGRMSISRVDRAIRIKGQAMINVSGSAWKNVLHKLTPLAISSIRVAGRMMHSRSMSILDVFVRECRSFAMMMNGKRHGPLEAIILENLRRTQTLGLASSRLSDAPDATTRSSTVASTRHGIRQSVKGGMEVIKTASRILVNSGTKTVSLTGRGTKALANVALISKKATIKGRDSCISVVGRGSKITTGLIESARRKFGHSIENSIMRLSRLSAKAPGPIKHLLDDTGNHLGHAVGVLVSTTTEASSTARQTIDSRRQLALFMTTRLSQVLKNLRQTVVACLVSHGTVSVEQFQEAFRIIVDSNTDTQRAAVTWALVLTKAALQVRDVSCHKVTHGIRFVQRRNQATLNFISDTATKGRRIVANGSTKSSFLWNRSREQIQDLSMRSYQRLPPRIKEHARSSLSFSAEVAQTIEKQQQQALAISLRLHQMMRTIGLAPKAGKRLSLDSKGADRLDAVRKKIVSVSFKIGHRVLVALRSHARLSKMASEDLSVTLSEFRRALVDMAGEGALHVGDLLEPFIQLPGVDSVVEGTLHATDLVETLALRTVALSRTFFVSASSAMTCALIVMSGYGLGIIQIGVASIIAANRFFKSRGSVAQRIDDTTLYHEVGKKKQVTDGNLKAWNVLHGARALHMDGVRSSGQLTVAFLSKAAKVIGGLRKPGDRVKAASSHLVRRDLLRKHLSSGE